MHIVDHDAIVDVEVKGPRRFTGGNSMGGTRVVGIAEDAFFVNWFEARISKYYMLLPGGGGRRTDDEPILVEWSCPSLMGTPPLPA